MLSQLYSSCPQEHFEDLFILENLCFHSIWTLRAKLLAFCRKLLISVVKSDFILSRGKVWGEKFFILKFASSSSHFQQKFLSASVKKDGGCVFKTVFYMSTGKFPGKDSFRKYPFFYQFQIFSWYFSACVSFFIFELRPFFWRSFWGKDVKIVF